MHLQNKPGAIWVLCFFIIGAACPTYGVDIPKLPPAPVIDLANIIDGTVKTKLNRYLRELERKTSAQVAILTIKSLDGQSLEDVSITVAHDKWQLGQKGKDNGVLMLVSLDDRKYRIEVGYGLEGILPDSLVGSIGRRYLVPNFRKGDYSAGIFAGALVIANTIAEDAGVKISGLPPVQKDRRGQTGKKSSGFFGKIISLLIFLVVIFIFIRNPRSFLALILLSSLGGRRSHWGGSGGGFGGGGFGSFGGGGGGFGGGGASGGW